MDTFPCGLAWKNMVGRHSIFYPEWKSLAGENLQSAARINLPVRSQTNYVTARKTTFEGAVDVQARMLTVESLDDKVNVALGSSE